MVSAAAAQRDYPADHEAGDRGARDQLAAVLADLAAPVGELADAAAQGLHGAAQVLTMGDEVGSDLRRGAPGGAGLWGTDWLRMAHLSPASSISRVRFASSIACSGTGGAPDCIDR